MDARDNLTSIQESTSGIRSTASESPYRRRIDKGVFKIGIAREELLVQEAGVLHIAKEREVDLVG